MKVRKICPKKYQNFKRDINQVFKYSLVQQHTRLNIYKTLARPVLICGSEACTVREAEGKMLQAVEIKFVRNTVRFTLLEQREMKTLKKKL
jgi:hypothetical protein